MGAQLECDSGTKRRACARHLITWAFLAAALGVSACGSSTAAPTTGGVDALATPTPAPTATAAPTAVPTPTPAPTATPTPTPATDPLPVSPHFTSRSHAVLAACRLVDAQTAGALVGAQLAKDPAVSGFVGGIDGGPRDYVQDDCGYASTSSGGPVVRVVLVEPSHGGGTSAQGQDAFAWSKEDLEINGHATLTKLDGLGDAAVVWAPAGASFAEVVVQDHEVVFSIGVENAPDPLNKAIGLATLALVKADSGAANGSPGS